MAMKKPNDSHADTNVLNGAAANITGSRKERGRNSRRATARDGQKTELCCFNKVFLKASPEDLPGAYPLEGREDEPGSNVDEG